MLRLARLSCALGPVSRTTVIGAALLFCFCCVLNNKNTNNKMIAYSLILVVIIRLIELGMAF
jgi:hypothetical protein